MIGLVVSSGDPAAVLDGAEEVFDEVTPAIHSEIARNFPLSVGFGRDHGESAALVKRAAKPIVVEALLADQCVDFDAVEQRFNADTVVALAQQEHEARQIAQRVDQGDDFGRQAATRTPDRLILSPPFAPVPCWWTADDGSVDQRARIDPRGQSSVAFNASALDRRSSPPAARKALSEDRRRQGQSLRCRAARLATQAEPR